MKIIPVCFSLFALALSAPPLAASPQGWAELAKLTASDAISGAYFGNAVDIDGDTMAIGAFGVDQNRGAAYVFVRSGSGWILEARIQPADAAPGDGLGDVALDGDTLLIGTSVINNRQGAAYVYVRSGTVWTEEAKLTASDGQVGDVFGSAVAIDGDTALISAIQDTTTWIGAGSAYVFTRTGTVWTERAKIVPDDLEDYDMFGGTVLVAEGNPTTLMIANTAENDHCDGCGSVYVYVGGGSSWGLQEKIHTPAGTWESGFGASLALSGDTAVIGEPGSCVTYWNGKAHVYVRSSWNWTREATLTASDGANCDQFGGSVSIEGDVVMVGASRQDGAAWDTGAAYVFERSGTTWTETQKLTPSDPAQDLRFGRLALSGSSAVIGAYGDNHAGANSGSAYVFSLAPGSGYCFGDPGVGTPCPCSNDNDGSVPGSGCDNGVFSSGAHLSAVGEASVGGDTLTLLTTGLEPNNTGLYFQGNNATNGGNGSWFGDGLRCAGGGVVRIQIRFCDSGGLSHTTIPIGTKGGAAPGDTYYYQCWYRNQSTPACGLGVNEFNLSNGYQVTWTP